VQPRRRGFFAALGAFIGAVLRFTLAVLVVAAIGIGAFVYFQRPAWAEPYVGPILGGVTSTTPTPATLVAEQVRYELEVTVAVNAEGEADASALRQAFLFAFTARAQSERGPNTQVAMNQPPTYVGGQPVQVASSEGQATFRATLEGYVYQQP
jgi:hypothetical protein